MTAKELEFLREDPPALKKASAVRYTQTAEALKGDPGEWYRIASGQRYPELATRIKQGKILSFEPAGSFEATTRKIDGLWSTWARYVGEDT